MAIVLNPNLEPAVNATVTVDNLPITVVFPTAQEVVINKDDDSITAYQGTNPWTISGTVTGPLTDAQLRASPVIVAAAGVISVAQSGTWSAGRTWELDSGTDSVNIGNFPATQPVSGPLTDTQLRASPVPISGTVTANTGLSQPLTDAQLRATPVPISGTITATPTGTQDVNLVSTITVPVSGTFFQATQPVSGTFFQTTQPISAAVLPLPSGAATAANQSTEITALGTINTTLGSPFQAGASIGNTTFAATQSGIWNITNITGTISLPTGAATAANQTTANASLASIDSKLTSPLSVTGSLTDAQLRATPVPISGTVTANAGTDLNTSLLALDSTVAKDASLTTINTSINTLLKPANTLAAVTTVGTITNVVHIDDNSGSLTVDGTVTANQGTSPWAVAGNVAAAASDSGNPVKTGGVYNSTLPTYTTGQRGDSQISSFGETAVVSRNKYFHSSASGATTVKSGAGRLHTLTIAPAAASFVTVTVYDNTAASGTIIAVLRVEGASNSTSSQAYVFDVEFSTGLTVNASAAADITSSYY